MSLVLLLEVTTHKAKKHTWKKLSKN